MSATCAEIANQSFDYVIIGGGTAGLTLAARLSEDPFLTIAVLEAGPENADDPLITIPAQFAKHFGDPRYDWAFETVPQAHCNGRVFRWPRGRMLGGSSAINFLAWSVPPSQDVDAWEKLGNPGWNWANFAKNVKKTERFIPPKVENSSKFGHKLNVDAHGREGPLITSFPDLITTAEVPIQETLCNVGIEPAKNPVNGDPIGTYMTVSTIDPRTVTRSYSVTASYLPNKHRSNLKVLCDALVHRITTVSEPEGSSVRANGVEFEFEGKVHFVEVKKDVILSAGALKSPQVLELSGIGDRSLLESLGIDSVVDLPGVGENLQEHMTCAVMFELNPVFEIETFDAFNDAAYAASQLKLHAQGKGLHRLGSGCFTFAPLSAITATPEDARALVARQRERIARKIAADTLPPGRRAQYELQLAAFESGKAGDCEIIVFPGSYRGLATEPGKSYISLMAAVNHTFSRGTIHAKSKDPHEQPEIDPHYLEDEFDLEVFVEIVKFIRRLPTIEPLKSIIAREISPGPSCTSDIDLRNNVKDRMNTTFHTAGTLSMLPRAHNGVVDPALVVYGTTNIRVVDLSVMPLHIAAHTQAAVYAIAEQAAGIIKAANQKE